MEGAHLAGERAKQVREVPEYQQQAGHSGPATSSARASPENDAMRRDGHHFVLEDPDASRVYRLSTEV
jgi:hypothetical protein